MATTTNITNITPPRVAIVDANGMMTREWYRFLFSLFSQVNTNTDNSTLTTYSTDSGGSVDLAQVTADAAQQAVSLLPSQDAASVMLLQAQIDAIAAIAGDTSTTMGLQSQIDGLSLTIPDMSVTAGLQSQIQDLSLAPAPFVYVAPASSGGATAVKITNDVTTSSPVYPLWYTGTTTTGTDTVYVSTSKITLVPSTGVFGVSALDTPAASTADLTAPATGYDRYGAKLWANRAMPIAREPIGNGYAVQGHFAQRNIRQWRFGAGATVTTLANATGVFPYTAVSAATPTIATPVAAAPSFRSVIGSTATAGTIGSMRSPTTNIGGVVMGTPFFATFRFGLAAVAATMRMYVGLVDVVAAPTNIDPVTATTPGSLGMATNASTQDFVIVNNLNGVARTNTALPTGSSQYTPIAGVSNWELAIWSDGTNVYWQTSVLDQGTSAASYIATGTFSSNKPATNTLLYPSLWITNNATAASATMTLLSVTLETEY